MQKNFSYSYSHAGQQIPHETGEHKLLHHLQKDYSPIIRPVVNRSSPVVVKFGFELKHILAIVESQQTITLKVSGRLNLWGTRARIINRGA